MRSFSWCTCEASHRIGTLPVVIVSREQLKTQAARWSVAGIMWSRQHLVAVGVDVSSIMMLMITSVARGARRHGSGPTIRGDHAEHAAAAGIAVHVLNIGPYHGLCWVPRLQSRRLAHLSERTGT